MIDALLLYNPAAGRSPLSQERLRHLIRKLELGGISCESVVLSPEPRDGLQLDLHNKSLLVVYGGDGTIHHAVQQAAGRDICLGLLPAGTANVLAGELGIPLDLDRALEVILRGVRRRMTLGRSGTRYFHLMAGIGLDACVIGRLNPRLKRRLGQGAFWIAGMQTFLRYQPTPFLVDLGDEKLEATFAVIANARNYGGNLRITPEADLSDPVLDVCLFTGRQRWRFLRYLWGALWTDLRRYPDVVYRKSRCLGVTGPRLPIQMDGEIVGRLPADFSIFTPGIEVLVPANRPVVVDSGS